MSCPDRPPTAQTLTAHMYTHEAVTYTYVVRNPVSGFIFTITFYLFLRVLVNR